MIPAYIITIVGYAPSMEQTDRAIQSSMAVGNLFPIEIFSASTPHTPLMESEGIEWRGRSALTKNATTHSHWRLWQECVKLNETILILEHDMEFTRRLDDAAIDMFKRSPYGACCLHVEPNPIGTEFEGIMGQSHGVLSRNYLLKPQAAQQLIETTKNVGYITQQDRHEFCKQFDFLSSFKEGYGVQEVRGNLRTSHWLPSEDKW